MTVEPVKKQLRMMNHKQVNNQRMMTKAKDCLSPAAYKELLHVIRYVLNMKNLGLKIKPMGNSNKPWEIICFIIAITWKAQYTDKV